MKKISIFSAIALFAILHYACDKSDPSPVVVISKPIFNPDKIYGIVTDQQGNVYKTITIGTQTWMAENLRATIYRDGTPIPEIRNDQAWNNSLSGAYSNYGNTANDDTIAVFGRLYNWYAVEDNHNIAPEGWHVPTHTEWVQLFDYLGGYLNAGGQLREMGTTHWLSPNQGADNSSGFTGLPGGMRSGDYFNGGDNAQFSEVQINGYWWSSSEEDDRTAKYVQLIYWDKGAGQWGTLYKQCGFSVRCVKD